MLLKILSKVVNPHSKSISAGALMRIFALIFYVLFAVTSILASLEYVESFYFVLFIIDVFVYTMAIYSVVTRNTYTENIALYLCLCFEVFNLVPVFFILIHVIPIFILLRSLVIQLLNIVWLLYRLLYLYWLRNEVLRVNEKKKDGEIT